MSHFSLLADGKCTCVREMRFLVNKRMLEKELWCMVLKFNSKKRSWILWNNLVVNSYEPIQLAKIMQWKVQFNMHFSIILALDLTMFNLWICAPLPMFHLYIFYIKLLSRVHCIWYYTNTLSQTQIKMIWVHTYEWGLTLSD